MSRAYRVIHKFGRNADIDTQTAPEDVWAEGGLMFWPQTAATLSVSSTDANDNSAGSGAQQIIVEGLDAQFNEIREAVEMNGATPVVTSQSFVRADRAYVSRCGTYHGNNAGTIRGLHTSNPMIAIAAGAGQTQLARYTVPAGRTLELRQVIVSVDSSKTATVAMWQVPNADDVTTPYSGARRLVLEFDGVSGEEIVRYDPALIFYQKTDLWFEVVSVEANATAVDVDFTAIYRKNTAA